jgi:hypothetical protein
MKRLKYFGLFLVVAIVVSCNIEEFEVDDTTNEVTTPDSEPEIELGSTTCEEAVARSIEAASSFAELDASSPSFVEACADYREVLEDQIRLCGDEGGVFQATINGLNCDANVESPELPTEPTNPFPENTNKRALMMANIDGEQFNNLRPNVFLLFNQAISVNGFFSRPDDDYLILQGGNTFTNPTLISQSSKQINIFIPSVLWQTGTFTMFSQSTEVDTPQIYYSFLRFDLDENIDKEDIDGEITINDFNREERFISGTFRFTFKLINNIDGTDQGTFNVTGTFDYSLDDDGFFGN